MVDAQTASKDAWWQMQTKIFWMRVSKFQTWNNFFWWCGIDWWILSCLYMLQAWRADQWASDSAFLGKINHNLWTISPNTDIWFFLWLFKMSLSRAICRQFFWFISYGEYSSSSKQIPPKPAWVCPPYVPSTNREIKGPTSNLQIKARSMTLDFHLLYALFYGNWHLLFNFSSALLIHVVLIWFCLPKCGHWHNHRVVLNIYYTSALSRSKNWGW